MSLGQFASGRGTLNANGLALDRLQLQAGTDPALAGESVHQAYVLLDDSGQVVFVSNPLEIRLTD